MSHRVVKTQFFLTSESKAANLKNEVESKVGSKNYDIFDQSITDGVNPDGEATLGVSIEFNVSSEADGFSTWLKSWMDTNQASFNQDGSVSKHGLMWVEHTVHDCYHNVEGINKPCNETDYKSWDIRP